MGDEYVIKVGDVIRRDKGKYEFLVLDIFYTRWGYRMRVKNLSSNKVYVTFYDLRFKVVTNVRMVRKSKIKKHRFK